MSFPRVRIARIFLFLGGLFAVFIATSNGCLAQEEAAIAATTDPVAGKVCEPLGATRRDEIGVNIWACLYKSKDSVRLSEKPVWKSMSSGGDDSDSGNTCGLAHTSPMRLRTSVIVLPMEAFDYIGDIPCKGQDLTSLVGSCNYSIGECDNSQWTGAGVLANPKCPSGYRMVALGGNGSTCMKE